MEESLQVLAKNRAIDLFSVLESICNDDLTSTNIRELFFLLARQSAFHKVAREYGLTYVPQYGPNGGKIFHFMTGARVEAVSLKDIVLESSRISTDFEHTKKSELPKGFDFVSSDLSKYSSNSIGLVWCVVRTDDNSNEIRLAVARCAQFIEFLTQKMKLATALDSLVKLNISPKATEREIDRQLVDGLVRAAFPDSVMIWRIDKFKRKISICEGTHKWSLQLNLGEGAAGKCAEDKKTLVIDDFTNSEELKSKGISYVRHPKFLEAYELRSGIFEPIILEDQTDTVVACYFCRPRGVTQTEKDIVKFISNNSRYYRHLLKMQNSKSEGKENLAKVASLLTFARDAKSYVHDAASLVGRADEQMFLINPRNDQEKQAKQTVIANLSQAKEHLSVALSLSEPPKTVRSGNVLFESDKDVGRHNITKIVQEVISTYQSESADSAIVFDQSKVEEGVRFSLSASQLRRALGNLIDNALYELKNNSLADRKVIEIEATLIKTSMNLKSPESELIICVRDNGPGIDKSVYGTLSEYFVTTKGEEGYGFGVAIVADIMRAHGGLLDWRDRGSKGGAEFELRFPQRG